MNRLAPIVAVAFTLAAGATARAQEALPSTGEIKSLVDAGKYREALKPLFRVLALKGPAAAGYDRIELLMLRAECQMQLKDQRGSLDTLDQARKEAFQTDRAQLAAEPTALAMLIQKSSAWQYKSKSEATLKPIPILDKTLRPAAYAALLRDELPAAQKKVHALSGAKSIAPVLEAAKLAGSVHAVDIFAHPNKAVGQLETTSLIGQVTSNADRLLLAGIVDLDRTVDMIRTAANQIVNDQVGQHDKASGKTFLVPRTRRRGVTDPEAATLKNINATLEKIQATSVEIALALATDFGPYQAIIEKANNVKAKTAAILREDYSIVPP